MKKINPENLETEIHEALESLCSVGINLKTKEICGELVDEKEVFKKYYLRLRSEKEKHDKKTCIAWAYGNLRKVERLYKETKGNEALIFVDSFVDNYRAVLLNAVKEIEEKI